MESSESKVIALLFSQFVEVEEKKLESLLSQVSFQLFGLALWQAFKYQLNQWVLFDQPFLYSDFLVYFIHLKVALLILFWVQKISITPREVDPFDIKCNVDYFIFNLNQKTTYHIFQAESYKSRNCIDINSKSYFWQF